VTGHFPRSPRRGERVGVRGEHGPEYAA